MSQYGEYLHGLYVIFYPFTLLNWSQAKIAWMLLNIILLVLIPTMICRKFSISLEKSILIIFSFVFALYQKFKLLQVNKHY